MQRRIKKVFKIITCAILLMAVVWVFLAAYIIMHKKELLHQVTDQLNKNINNKQTIQIRDMEPKLFGDFPNVSVTLKEISLRDSSGKLQTSDSTYAKKIFVSINVFSLFAGNIRINKVTVKDACLSMEVDSAGHLNPNFFIKNRNSIIAGSRISKFSLEDVIVLYNNRQNGTSCRFNLKTLDLNFSFNDTGWVAKAGMNILMMDYTGRTTRIDNKTIKGNFTVTNNQVDSNIKISSGEIRINGTRWNLAGAYTRGHTPQYFLSLKAPEINFEELGTLIPQNVAMRLVALKVRKPIQLVINITNRLQPGELPELSMKCIVKNNEIQIKGTTIKDCSFEGYYTNRAVNNKSRNERISLYQIQGNWAGIAFKSDTLMVNDLGNPVIACKLSANFPMEQLNFITGEKFHFNNGSAEVNLTYKGEMNNRDTSGTLLGSVVLKNAGFIFLPNNLTFTNSNLILLFNGKSVNLKDGIFKTGSNLLHIDGYLDNCTGLYCTNAAKMTFDCKLFSPRINLDEFTVLFNKKSHKKRTVAYKDSIIATLATRFDQLVDLGKANLELKIDTVVYKKLKANTVSGNLLLSEDGIDLKDVSVNQCGGTLTVNAALRQGSGANQVTLDVAIEEEDIKELFRSFDNFGLRSLTYENIDGKLNAKAHFIASFTDKAHFIPGTVKGDVSFSMEQGALKNFEPVEKIGKYVFRNRDLSDIRFDNLEDTLHVIGEKVIIDPMHIASSAITININGTYGYRNGTDINIDVPLRNPKKDELADNDLLRAKRRGKGLVAHFRAIDGENGNIKIKWVLSNNKGD